MKLTQRQLLPELDQQLTDRDQTGDSDELFGPQPAPRPEGSVFCQHSIHDGHFPVLGLTVGDARRTLAPLLNIDPEAVAVIDGRVVDEDRVIGEDVRALAFVKPSSVKG